MFYRGQNTLFNNIFLPRQDEEIATTIEGTRLSIQSRKNPEVDDKITLNLTKLKFKDYALRLKVPDFEGIDIILEDTYTNEQLLVKPDKDYVYYYSIDNEASSAEDRF